MNLFFLSVWYVLITSFVCSIPRRRHTKSRHYVTVAMVHRHRPTALQFLETKLLDANRHCRQGPSRHRKSHPERHQKRKSGNGTIAAFLERPGGKPNIPNESSAQEVAACVASFGLDSPLCKTRSEIRRQSRELRRKISEEVSSEKLFGADVTTQNFRPPGHVKRSFTKNIPVVEDYFGLFSTSSCTGSSQLNQTHCTSTCPSSSSSSSVTGHSTNKHTGILLPGSLAKLQDSQSLFLDQESGSNKEGFFNTDDDSLAGDGNGEVNHGQSTQETETNSTTVTPTTTPETDSTIPTSNEPELHWTSKTTQASNEHLSNDKLQCVAKHGKNCLCSLESLVQDVRKIFSTAKSPKEAFDKVFHVRCKKYVPVPESFDLSPNMKPRVLSAAMKVMSLDADKGPKELAEKSLEDFLDHLNTEEDDVSRVFVNTDVRLPCFPTRNVHLSPSHADHVTYTWTHGNKEAITEGRVSENADADGTLAIEDVSVADTDNYTCEVSFTSPDTGEWTDETYEHALTVVALPVVTVRVTVHYRAPVACDSSLLEMTELYLPQQLEQAVCQGQGLCTVQVHSPLCYSERQPEQERVARSVGTNGSDVQSGGSPPIREPRQAGAAGGDSLLMSLNYELYTHRQGLKGLTAANASLCDPTCHLLLTFRVLQHLRDSMADIVLTPVKSGVANLSGVLSPLASTVKLRYVFGCLGGYRLDDGFCVACERGHFSEDGWTECLPCPAHSYMGRPGARRCISCQSHWVLYCNEYVHTTNVFVIVGVVLAAVLGVACLVLYYNIAKKGRKLAGVMKSVRGKKPHRRAKLARSQKRMSPSKLEMQLLVQESSAEESDTDVKR